MNTKTYCITRMFLSILPFFLLACSLSVNIGTGDNSPSRTPTATVTSNRMDSEPSPSIGQAVSVSKTMGMNVALDKKIINRNGGINYPDWGNANDGNDYGTTTRAEKGRWGHQTNASGGTYEVVDLGREYTLNGVGYSLDWDGAFANPLTFQVLASTDNENWTMIANTIHCYDTNGVSNRVNIDLAIVPTRARYVKYWEPPDGAWNGWGDFFQLRAYAED